MSQIYHFRHVHKILQWKGSILKFKLCLNKFFTLCFFPSLPQEDSDYERDEHAPPTPPPRKLSRRGASLRLACIGKQQSDENPLMKKIAEPLKLAQTQVW